MIRRILLPALLLTTFAGCVRRDGSNTDCKWPGEADATKLRPDQTGYARHLTADAEFAEELADRYALRKGRGNLQSYELARAQCADAMFSEVARMHGVTTTEVTGHLGTNRALIDIPMNLPFFLLYVLASAAMARRIWKSSPPSEGSLAGTAMVLLWSVAFGVIGVLSGELWSITTESFRIGAGHLGIRASRLPWARYRSTLAACLVVLFWLVAAVQARLSKGNGPRMNRSQPLSSHRSA